MYRFNPELVAIGDRSLYHGTSFRNLRKILSQGLLPAKEVGARHKTKTITAIFLTDEIQIAAFYSTHGDFTKPVVVLEIDTTGIELQPDYDDVGELIGIDLEALSERLERDLNLGDSLTDEEEQILEKEGEWMEDRLPYTLEAWNNIIVARPYVAFGINSDGPPELYDNDSEIYWQDGAPHFIGQQYLVQEKIPPERITSVFLSEDLTDQLKIMGQPMHIRDYATIEGEQEEELDFPTVTLYKISPTKISI